MQSRILNFDQACILYRDERNSPTMTYQTRKSIACGTFEVSQRAESAVPCSSIFKHQENTLRFELQQRHILPRTYRKPVSRVKPVCTIRVHCIGLLLIRRSFRTIRSEGKSQTSSHAIHLLGFRVQVLMIERDGKQRRSNELCGPGSNFDAEISRERPAFIQLRGKAVPEDRITQS